MHMIKIITSWMLVILFLCSGFPVYRSEDVNKDLKIDLHDAITLVKCVAEDVNQPGNFKKNVGRAVSTLTVAAGLKTIIKNDNKSVSYMGYSLMDNPFLMVQNLSLVYNNSVSIIKFYDCIFQSHTISPDIRPPQV